MRYFISNLGKEMLIEQGGFHEHAILEGNGAS